MRIQLYMSTQLKNFSPKELRFVHHVHAAWRRGTLFTLPNNGNGKVSTRSNDFRTKITMIPAYRASNSTFISNEYGAGERIDISHWLYRSCFPFPCHFVYLVTIAWVGMNSCQECNSNTNFMSVLSNNLRLSLEYQQRLWAGLKMSIRHAGIWHPH